MSNYEIVLLLAAVSSYSIYQIEYYRVWVTGLNKLIEQR
jgi:hypothetical protein